MKKIKVLFVLLSILFSVEAFAQEHQNHISCLVNGEEFYAEAKRLKLPTKHWDYIAIAAFKVSPDIQVWIRIMYLKGQLEPGTYEIVSQEYLEKSGKKKKEVDPVYVLVDYTEETSKLGHGFHDGESLSGTLTIESLTPTSISGTFEATLNGVHFKKKGLATVTGTGIRSNINRKIVTQAGGGMLTHGDPHYHPNTKKLKETDTIILSEGRFNMDWSKDKGDE
jgi:hypothetical protein